MLSKVVMLNSVGIESLVLSSEVVVSVLIIMNKVLRMLLVVMICVCIFGVFCVWISV